MYRPQLIIDCRNGMKRQPPQVEDVGEILQMCQSTQWTERKEGLTCLHTLIYRKKNFRWVFKFVTDF